MPRERAGGARPACHRSLRASQGCAPIGAASRNHRSCAALAPVAVGGGRVACAPFARAGQPVRGRGRVSHARRLRISARAAHPPHPGRGRPRVHVNRRASCLARSTLVAVDGASRSAPRVTLSAPMGRSKAVPVEIFVDVHEPGRGASPRRSPETRRRDRDRVALRRATTRWPPTCSSSARACSTSTRACSRAASGRNSAPRRLLASAARALASSRRRSPLDWIRLTTADVRSPPPSSGDPPRVSAGLTRCYERQRLCCRTRR